MAIYLTTDDIVDINERSGKEGFKFKLDKFHVKQLKTLGSKVTWIVAKTMPMHVLGNKQVDRYIRVFFRPDISNDREDDSFEGMSSDELAAIVGLQSFAIDIAEDVYNEFFGNFEEMEFEND